MLIDISLPIKEGMRTWPGEDWVKFALMTEFEKKGVRVSKLTLGSHSGTHIDAPRHFLKDGGGIDSIPVEKFVGPCVVIEMEPQDGKGITAEDIKVALNTTSPIPANFPLTGNIAAAHEKQSHSLFTPSFTRRGNELERHVLFKTRNSAHLADVTFYDEYVYLAASGAEYLLEQGVDLVGIDYLSIEKRGSLGHPVHTMLLENGVVILEGANLAEVKPGRYGIMAFPLRLEGLDGSPARVLLKK